MPVREARLGDEDAIRTVHERSVRQIASKAYSEDVVEAWTMLEDDESAGATASDEADVGEEPALDGETDAGESTHEIQPDDGKLFVAVAEESDDGGDGASIVGFGDVRFHPPEYLREPVDGGVRAVYVDPDHAGEGVGSALLERLERTARDHGLDSLGLHSSVNARDFYEERGYDPVSEIAFEFGDEVEGPAVEMRKGL